jgi:hypothetical protein
MRPFVASCRSATCLSRRCATAAQALCNSGFPVEQEVEIEDGVAHGGSSGVEYHRPEKVIKAAYV